MISELIIMKWNHKILSLQVKEREIIQINAEDVQKDNAVRLGDIYVGKVRNVVKNINAAFVEIAEGTIGYLSLSQKVPTLHTQGFPYQEGRVLIGDEIIVQVAKEASKTKPPTLSGVIDITGRYVVLTTGKLQACVSKKIRGNVARQSLQRLLSGYCCGEYGFIARTNSADVPGKLVCQEMERLSDTYEEIVSRGMHTAPLTCLYKAPPGYLCDIRDGYAQQLKRIITDDKELYGEIHRYLEQFWQEAVSKLTLWDPARGKMDAVYNVERTLERAMMKKVWLKSGAYLVIQPTEALVAIDVNSGKAVSKKKDVQETYLKINKEAANEIARQLRLRNLSGIILVDFIDMESKEANRELMETLRKAVRSDQMHTTALDITKLGLVEMTRKKMRKSLFEQLR